MKYLKLMKRSADTIDQYFTSFINDDHCRSSFLDSVKETLVRCIYKKGKIMAK